MRIAIEELLISPGHDFYGRHGKGRLQHGIEECSELELVAGKGIVGDRFYDYKEDYKGQVTFFEAETWEAVKAEFDLPELTASAFRRNVVVRGVALSELIGKRFTIGELAFEGTQEAAPCYWMDEACAPGAEEFLKGRGGLRCRIVAGGQLSKGEYGLRVLSEVG